MKNLLNISAIFSAFCFLSLCFKTYGTVEFWGWLCAFCWAVNYNFKK